MAANKFGRYVWLVDLIRCHPYITFKEISDKWEDCGLGDGKPLPWKTFMNHKDAVQTIFDIIISCDAKRGYGYYIEDADLLEGNSFRSWLIDSYATLNQLQADKKLEKRISFEKILSAIRWNIDNALGSDSDDCFIRPCTASFLDTPDGKGKVYRCATSNMWNDTRP